MNKASSAKSVYVYSDTGKVDETSSFSLGSGSSYAMNSNTALGGIVGQSTGGTGSGTLDGEMSFFYFDDSYTDFSQEANRNKFVDQLGYPRDLTQQIEDGDIPNPLIYMKFDPTVSLGTNSGTGGNFSAANGTVTAGADVTI